MPRAENFLAPALWGDIGEPKRHDDKIIAKAKVRSPSLLWSPARNKQMQILRPPGTQTHRARPHAPSTARPRARSSLMDDCHA
jgi:hypothetical protein